MEPVGSRKWRGRKVASSRGAAAGQGRPESPDGCPEQMWTPRHSKRIPWPPRGRVERQPEWAEPMNAMVIDWNAAMTNKRLSAKPAAKTCEQYSVDLSAYFDGELEGAEQDAVELHLKTCEACTRKLDNLKRLRRAMSALSTPIPRRGSVLDLLRAEMQGERAEKAVAKRPLS